MSLVFTSKRNNAYSTLLSNHTSGSGTIIIQSGDQSRFPSTYPFRITVYIANTTLTSPQAAGTIFWVNSASANTFNVTVAPDESPTSVDQTFTVGGSYPINVECDFTYGAEQELETALQQLNTYNNTYFTDTGSANTYVITPSPALTAYSAGQTFNFLPANSSTGASTLNVNGLGAKSILFNGIVLGAGSITVSNYTRVIYDGTNFQLTNSQAQTTLAYAQQTTPQTSITTEVDLTGLTVTITIPTGWTRRIQIMGFVLFSNTTATQPMAVYITKDGTDVQLSQVGSTTSGNAYGCTVFFEEVPAAGSHTYKLRGSAGGSATLACGTSNPAYISVKAF